MSENKNSAFRIKKILEQAKKKSNNSVSEVWKEVFNIEIADNNKVNFEVSRCLSLLHDEVELLRQQMDETEFSRFLYNPAINKINTIIGIQTITSSWASYQKRITPEVILSLGFCSEILPADEIEIPEEQIDEIIDLVQSLEKSIAESSLPLYTKRVVTKHINKIKQALENYTVIGARAFNEVVQSAYGEVIDNATIFEEAKSTTEIGALAKIWKKIKVTSDNAVILEKGIVASKKIGENTAKAIEFIQGF